jgi:hypothetical protein
MDREQTVSSQQEASEEPLSLPHFEEEFTLLSAKPVVPLREVRAKTRRRLIFGLMIVAAVLVGAFGELIYTRRELKEPTAVLAGANESASDLPRQDEFASSSGAAGGSSVHSDVTAVSAPDEAKESTMRPDRNARNSVIAENQAPRVAQSARSVRASEGGQKEIDDAEGYQRQLRQAQRREARRFRREAERERHNRSADDLLRIREIFEGSPRP